MAIYQRLADRERRVRPAGGDASPRRGADLAAASTRRRAPRRRRERQIRAGAVARQRVSLRRPRRLAGGGGTEHADVVQRYLGQLADFGTKAFTALNTALAADGAYVHIPDGVVLEQPLQLLFVTTAAGIAAPIMSNVRALIVAGDRSQVADCRNLCRPARLGYFTNAVTEVFAGEGAVVDHYKVQQESIDAFHVASMHVHAGTERQLLFALVFARRPDRPQRCRSRCSTERARSAR